MALPQFTFSTIVAWPWILSRQQFIIASSIWGENSGLFQYSFADKKCTTLKSGIATFLALYSPDGKSFLYSLASHGETTVFRQPLHNGTPVGAPVPALKLPVVLREDYNGNAFMVSRDLSSVVLRPPQRPRRPLLPLPKIIEQVESREATKFTSPARKCGDSRKRKKQSRESDGIH